MTALIRFSKPCDECGGTGSIQVERVEQWPADSPSRMQTKVLVWDFCPSCVGGWLPDDKTVEAAAGVLHEKGFREVTRKMLVAAARYQSES